MKRLIALTLALLLVLSGFATVSASSEKTQATFLYVSPTGSDSANGSIKAPLATIEKALAVAKTYEGTTVINLREGEYQLTSTISMNATNKNIVLRSMPGETATITAGTALPFSSFTAVTDTAFLNKLSDQTARNKIVSANISSLGVTDFGIINYQGMGSGGSGYAPTLSYKDTSLQMARYPNDGYLYTATVTANGKSGSIYNYDANTGVFSVDGTNASYIGKAEFTVSDKRYQSWAKKDVWAFGYFQYDWADTTTPCGFTAGDSITTYVSKNYGVGANRRFYFFNVPEEIDQPGEWYLDRTTGVLYLYPTTDMQASDKLIYSSSTKNFFNISYSSNISFEGIKFTGTCGSAITASNADNIKIYCCEFSSIGDMAVSFTSCTNSGVDCSDFHDLGSWGVYLNGCGDRTNLVSGGCYVTNSEFENFQNYRRTYASAIEVNLGVGVYIAHNKIHNAPHFAMQFITNDCIMEYNDIYDVCRETRDCGAVYTGRHWDTWGNIFRYNYVHDMKADASGKTGYSVHGIYLDDMSAQTDVYGNVFESLPSVALIGGGRNNSFVNNYMINCDNGITYDQRAANTPDPSSPYYCKYTYKGVEKEYSWGVSTCFYSLLSSPYLSEAWKAKYTGNPKWTNSAQQYMLDDSPEIPKYATVKENIKIGTGARGLAAKVTNSSWSDIGDDLTVAQSAFVDYANEDYTLTSSGLATVKATFSGFENVNFKSIGQTPYIYDDKYESNKIEFESTSATQSSYFKYTKNEEETTSKHALYAYARYSGGKSLISEIGFEVSNEKGVKVKCPMHEIPTTSAFAVRFVGTGFTPGTYTLKPYIIDKNGDTIFGDEKSILIDNFTKLGTNDVDGAKVTVYEIEEFN